MLNQLKTQLGSSMQTMRRFLERPISVQKGGVSLGATASSLRAQARDEHRERVRRMRRDLYQLMQQHPGSRELMRHLDLVERTLRKEGFTAVEALPVRVLTKALTQLERLVWDWTPVGLAELRSRLAVAVKTRPPEAEQQAAGTAAMELELATTHDAADVSEVDHAAFEEMERSWTGQMPASLAKAVEDSRAR